MRRMAKRKRPPTKQEIYDEIGAAMALLEKKRPDKNGAVERLKSLRNAMLGDVIKASGNDAGDLLVKQALMDIVEGKPMNCAQFVHVAADQKSPAVCSIGDKFLYLHSHMLVVGNRNATDLPVIALDPANSIAKSVGAMMAEDYRKPCAESFGCMPYEDIRTAIKSVKGSMNRPVNNEVVYRFKNGPALKATYYMWAVLLTGAEKLYVKPGVRAGDGKKAYNKIIYFHGKDFDAYVCPVMSAGGDRHGFYRWNEAF